MRFIILLLLLSITIEQGIFLSKYYFEDYYKYEKCDKLEINIPFQIIVPPLFIILLILHNNISKIKTSIVNKLIWIILFGYMGLSGWLIFILRKNNDLCNKYLRNEKFNHWLGCLFIVGTSIIIILYVFKQIISNLI